MVIKIILIVLAVYIVLIVGPALLGATLIFSKKTGTPLTETDIDNSKFAPYKEKIIRNFDFFERQKNTLITIENDDIRLFGEYYDRGNGRVALFFHGYRSTPLNNFFAIAKDLWDMGYSIAFVWQRAHLPSEGEIITVGLREQYDCLKWINLFDADENVNEILLVGASMGCATIGYASDKIDSRKVSGMILDCGFTSVYDQIASDMRHRHIPPVLLMPIVSIYSKLRYKLDIKKKVSDSLKRTKIPALFLHGKLDETVPVNQGIRNYKACASKKGIVIVDNAYHSQAYVAGGTMTKNKLLKFIEFIKTR